MVSEVVESKVNLSEISVVWETLGPLAQSESTQNCPRAIYRAHESTVTFTLYRTFRTLTDIFR